MLILADIKKEEHNSFAKQQEAGEMEEEEGRRKWEDLEPDCLLNIFQRLSLDDLTLVMPFVCKSWYEASLDPLCWTILSFRTSDFATGSKFAKPFEAKFAPSSFSFKDFLKSAVRRSCKLAVELRLPDHASLDDLAYASNECPRLKSLALPNLEPGDETHIPKLVGKWKDLERLEMDLKPSCFTEIIEEIGISCAKFSELTMCGSIERRDALAIVEFTPKLKYLDLSRSYLPKDELMLIMKGCKEIERLRVNYCIGFQADKDVLEMASNIMIFEHEGSKFWDYSAYK